MIHLVFRESRNRDWAYEGSIDLQCQWGLKTLAIQLTKIWFIAHLCGWASKMVIFRDWTFCLVNSLAFECTELSLHWLIPEFLECWWDSLVLDVIIANMIGMLLGVVVLRFLLSYKYDWMESRGAYSQLLVRLMPFAFTAWDWSFFDSPLRLFQAAALLFFSLLAELNVFFLINALELPVGHIFHFARLFGLCWLAVPAVAEYYQYINSKDPRFGANTWLFLAIVVMETVFGLRHGSFPRARPPRGVWLPWAASITCLGVWCYWFYWRRATPAQKKKKRLLAPWVCFLPLLSLCRYYKFAH
eukprot:Polyplicarium_translucidae@DN2317_c0_g1_i3.p1